MEKICQDCGATADNCMCMNEPTKMPDKIFAFERVGSNGIHCLDYRDSEADVEYLRADKENKIKPSDELIDAYRKGYCDGQNQMLEKLSKPESPIRADKVGKEEFNSWIYTTWERYSEYAEIYTVQKSFQVFLLVKSLKPTT